MDSAQLTIAIPTFNRADYFKTALASLLEQSDQSDRWKVFVVDNGSTDATNDLLVALCQQHERLEFIVEPQSGSSRARNAALERCQTPYILFVDDECTFPKSYVAQALTRISKDEPILFGGPVMGQLQPDAPDWYLPSYGGFSLPHTSARGGRIFLSGGNMGFDVEALRAIGGFDPDLGMAGAKLGFGEETAVELKMLRKFGSDAAVYDPELINYHFVRQEKYRWEFLIKEHFARGRARAQMARLFADVLKASEGQSRGLGGIAGSYQKVTRRKHWQNYAYEYGLPLVRRTGFYWEQLASALGGRHTRP